MSYETMDFEGLFGEKRPDAGFSVRSSAQNRAMVRNEHERLQAFCRQDAVSKTPNHGLRRFTRGGVCGLTWGGPVIVARHRTEPKSEYFLDMDMLDIRHAADFLSSAQRSYVPARPVQPHYVEAAGILCYNTGATGTPYYPIINQATDPVFMTGGNRIANLIGLPLLVRTSGGSYSHSRSVFIEAPLEGANPMAALLKRDIVASRKGPLPESTPPANIRQSISSYYRTIGKSDKEAFEDYRAEMGRELSAAEIAFLVCYAESSIPNTSTLHEDFAGFGATPAPYNIDQLGPVIVARADCQPLQHQHLEAICEYIKQKVEPKMRSAVAGLEVGDTVTDYEEILNGISKTAFLEFWNEYKSAKAINDPHWRDMWDPYEKCVIPRKNMAEMYEKQVRAHGTEAIRPKPRLGAQLSL
jgi:hypothetical protein